jgi:hypothetical protein
MSKAKTKWEQRKEKIGYVPAESSAPEYSNAARENWENRPQTKARRSNSFSAYTDKEIEMLLQNNPAYVYAQAYGTRKTLTKGSDALAYGKKKEEERKPGQINAMGAGDYGASNPTRFDKTVNAAIYGAGASLSNLFGLLDEKDAQTRARDEADSARLRAGREASLQGEDINMREGGLKKQSEDSKKDFDERAAKLAGAGQKAFDRADRLQQTAYDYEQSAKAGLGKFGRGMVDFGIAATQFAGDAVMNAVLPGSGLAMMGARAAGGASHEARLAGKDLDTQLVTGLKSAAIEIMTEKLFGAVSHVAYGKGIIRNESLVNGIVNKLAKTDAGRTALKVIVGANEEGLEEVLSDILNPIADRILKLDDGNGDWSTIGDDFDAEEMAKDYIIGAALGLVGAGTNVINGQYKAENAQQRAYEDYQKRLVEAGLHTESGSDVQVTAEQYKNILDKSAKRGNRNLSDKETKNLEALMRNSYAQEDAADINSRLTQLGTQPDEQTVNAIVKTLNGEKLNTKEQRAFDANPYSQRVVNEMLDPYGITTNEWYADRASMGEFEPEKGDVNTWERMQNALDRSNVNGVPKRAVGGNAATENSVEHKTASAMSAKYNVPSDTISRVYRLNPASPQAFEQGFDAAYKMGQQGAKKAALGSITVLNQAQAEIAYKMGADTTQEVKTDGVYLRDGGKRTDGENTEGQAPAVERGTGKADSGADSRAKGIARKDQGKAGEEVVYGGVKQKGVYYAKTDTAEMKSGREIAKNHGYDVVYFAGGNIETDGVAFRASIDTDSHTVTVRADHPDYSVDQLLRHELMHETINSGEADLSEIRSKLLESLSEPELDELIDAYASAYGGILSHEEAFEEICCDAMGKMNIFEGTQLNSESYEKALSLVREYAADKGSNKSRAPPEGGSVMYSREVNGKQIAWIENNPMSFRDLANYKKVAAYIANHIGEAYTILESGYRVYIGENLPKEYTQSEYTKALLRNNQPILRAKKKAIGSFGEMIEIATNRRWENTKHAANKDAKYGVYRYSTAFAFPVKQNGKIKSVKSFDAELVILNSSNGKKYLYDIVNIKENTADETDLMKRDQRRQNAATRRGASENSIRDSDANVNKKFSMEAPIEQKKNLIALHNLDETKLLKTLKLGGFPMPSIAITKSDIPHTNFGNITVVFGKETVDPKFDRRNTVYSADAWTPLFPRMEYEANEKAAQRIRRKYYELEKKHGHDFVSPLYESANYLDDTLTKYGGVEELIDKFADDTRMMQIYLADTGRTPVESVKTETITRLTDNQIEVYDALINTLGADVLNDMAAKHNEAPFAARKAWFAKHGDALKAAFEQYYTKNGIDAKTAKSVVDAMKPAELIKEATNARKYLKDGAETRKTEVDIDATNNAIRKAVDSGEYIKWLNDLYGDAVKDSGFYNNKDYYTPSGNRRSFKATHYPNTLDGIVKAMASQGDGNSRNVMGFHGVKSLRAGTAERFKSVEDMHKLEGRLKHLTAEEASQISEALDSRLSAIMHDIYDLTPHSSYSNELLELDSIGEVLMEATELKYVSPANVKALFKKYNYPLTDKMASDIVALLFDVNNMPVNIFEAKPERAVGFDEIRKVIIPDTSSDELRTALKNAGIESVEEYAAGDDAARMKIANDVPNVHFSREPEKFGRSKPFDKRRKKEPIETGGKKRYNKSGNWSETETLFMQWENGSAPVGEVKKFTRFKKHHYYEKTADGCVEITRAEYNKRSKYNVKNIKGRAERRISRVANFDGSAGGDVAGHSDSNRNTAGAEILSRHTIGERLRNDAGGSVSSVDRDGTGVSDGIDLSREPETLNELRRQNTQLKKRVEYWRGQAKTTRVKTVREGDVKKLAREIIEMNATDLKPKDITEQLGELGKYILNSEELRYTDISKMADDIASDVIENATAILNTDDAELHNELKDYLKSVKLLDDGSAEFAELRTKYKRRIMFKKSGLPVDVAYMELRGMFGETYFPEDIINVADQFERIGEVLDLTEPRYHNPNDYYSAVAREYLRNYIIDAMLSDEVRQTAPTYADRKEAQIAKLKADNAQAMRDEREKQAQKIASIKERNAQRIKDAVAKERERGEKRLERLRDSVERRDAKRKDIAEKERYKAQIEKNVKALSNWLLKPDHKNALKHIPGELQSTVRDFIASIDFTSARRLGGGDLTIKDTDYLHNLERLHKFVSDSNLGEDRYSGYLDLPPNFEAQLGDFIREVNGLARRNSGYTINDMTAAQLKELSDIVKVMKKTITDMNRMYQNATFRFAYDAGASDVENLVNIANTKPFLARNITSTIDNFVMWQQARPAHAFARFGEGGKSICRELMEGQSEMAFLTKKIIDFSEETYTTEEVKAWAKETHTFRFGDDTVTMTTAQLMGLYELNKRAKAQQHLETGGFKIANFKDKGDKIKRDTRHRLNEVELGKMFSELTDRQKEVADKLQQFMAKTGGEWGNYVSVKRFDVEMFKEADYYPMKVNNTEVNTKEDQSVDNASLYKLLNMSFTKELSPKANQSLVVYDIFDVFSNHMAEMAQYRSFALPVLDAMKWFNYKERDESGREVYSLREEMSRVFGSDENGNGYAERFVSNILRAYNGTEARGSTYETLGMKSLSFHNRAAVAFNLRVVAQQPTAIARAAIILNEKDLASSFAYVAKNFKATAEEMEAHSGIALWKSLGFYDVNIGKGVQELIKHDQKWVDRFLEVGMKGAKFADRYTWAAMWEACKRDVRRKGIKDGDAQFFDKVSELFDEVIYKTQVVDSVLTKNEWGRSKNFFPRMMGSFMSEPATTASMVTDAIFNIQLDRARGMEWSEIKKKHNATVGKVIEVYALQAIFTSLLAAISDAKRDDDDYATFAEKLWDSFKGNLAENLDPLNWYIFASDVVDLGKQILGQFGFDTYGYGQQNVWLQGAEQLLKAIEITRDLANDEKTNYTAFGAAMKWIQAGSQFAGLPAYNIARELYSTWNTIIGDFLGYKELKIKTYDPGPKKSIKYAYMDGYLTEEEAIEALQDESTMGDDVLDADKAWLEVEKWKNDTSSNYAKLYTAIDTGGDIKAAVNELVEHGVDAGKIKSAITRKYKDAYINGDAQERERIRKAMYATGLYGSANEIVEKCNSWLK